MVVLRRKVASLILGYVLIGTIETVSGIVEDINVEQVKNGEDTKTESKMMNKFFDVSSMEDDEKLELVKSIVLLRDTGEDVDWVKAKENYQLSTSMDFKNSDNENFEQNGEENSITGNDEASDRRRLGLLSNIYSAREDPEPTMNFRSSPYAPMPQPRSGHMVHDSDEDHDDGHRMHQRHRTRKGYKRKSYKSKHRKHYKSKKKSKKAKYHYHYVDDYYYYDDHYPYHYDDYYYYDDLYYDDYYDDYYYRHTHRHEHNGNSHTHSHPHFTSVDHHSVDSDSEDADDAGAGIDDGGGTTDPGGYNFGRGACPDSGSSGVPCAPDDLPAMCDKYSNMGSFRSCFEACKPSFCCIHDAQNNNRAVPCPGDENCSQYSYCYIVWWKLHDTIGPASYLQLEQADDFFDIQANEVRGDVTGDGFFEALLLHHFDNIQNIIAAGTVAGTFDANQIFNDPLYW